MQTFSPIDLITEPDAPLTCWEKTKKSMLNICQKIKDFFIYIFDCLISLPFIIINALSPSRVSLRVIPQMTLETSFSDNRKEGEPEVISRSITPEALLEIEEMIKCSPTQILTPNKKTPSPDSTRSLEGWELTSLNSSPTKRKDS